MITLFNQGSGWELGIFIIAFLMIIMPIFLFIYGFVVYSKNEIKGKKILIAATIYALISAGICGGTML